MINLNMFNRKYKLEPWVIIYRRLKKYCNNSNCSMYKYYGKIGYKFDFTSSREIKFLWQRDDASKLKDPALVRKSKNKSFNKNNCYFVESAEWACEEFRKAINSKQNKF